MATDAKNEEQFSCNQYKLEEETTVLPPDLYHFSYLYSYIQKKCSTAVRYIYKIEILIYVYSVT